MSKDDEFNKWFFSGAILFLVFALDIPQRIFSFAFWFIIIALVGYGAYRFIKAKCYNKI